jgi:hypothetical protein
MPDVNLTAHASGFSEANTQVEKLKAGLVNLQGEIRKAEGDFRSAVWTGNDQKMREAANTMSRLIDQERDLGIHIERVSKGLVNQKPVVENTSNALEGLSLSSQRARMHLAQLGKEVVTGDFSRLPQTMGSLVVHSGAYVSLLNPLVLGVTAAVGAIGFLAVALIQGRNEMKEVNKAIETTNNFAGLMRNQMLGIAESVRDMSHATIGSSKEIVTAVVASGRFSAENVNALSGLVARYVDSTGQDVEKVTPKLIKMFQEPSKALKELDHSWNFLDATQLQYIRSLEEQGRWQDAASEAIKLTSDEIDRHIPKLNLLGEAWQAIKKSVSEAKNEMGKWGQDATPQDRLAAEQAKLADLQLRSRKKLGGVAPEDLAEQKEMVRMQQALVNALQAEAVMQGEAAQKRREQKAILDEINKSQLANLEVLQNKLKSIEGDDSPKGLERQKELRLQILGIQRGMTAESRSQYEAEITGVQNLNTLAIKMDTSRLDSLLKLGVISQEDHDERILHLRLEENERLRGYTQQRLSMGLLTNQERQRLEIQLVMLGLEKERIELLGKEAAAALLKKQQDEQNKRDLQAQDAQRKVNEDSATALGRYATHQSTTLRNLQIELSLVGKTAEQRAAITSLNQLEGEYLKEKARIEESTSEFKKRELETLELITEEKRKQIPLAASELVRMKEAALAAKRGFESGKTFAQNFRDTLINIFKTLVLTPVIKFLVSPISQGVSNTVSNFGFSGANTGSAGANSNSGGFSNLLSLGGNASNFFSSGGMYAGAFGSTAAYSSALGVGASQAGMLAAQTGVFGAAGLSATAGAAGAGTAAAGVSALGAVAAVAPYVAAAIAIYSAFSSKKSPARFTGLEGSGLATLGGIENSQFFGTSKNDTQSFRWDSHDHGALAGMNATITGVFNDMTKLAQLLKLDSSKVTSAQVPFSFITTEVGPNGLGPTTEQIVAAFNANVTKMTDTLALQLMPNLLDFAEANETATMTLTRLAMEARQINLQDISGKMGAAVGLKDATRDLFLSELSPLTNAQRLAEATSRYSSNLASARGGDTQSISNLSGSSRNYLQEARNFYASSTDYTSIFNAVQTEIEGLVEDTLTEQSIRFAEMGLTLKDISANTKDIDQRIADKLTVAIAAWQEANAAVQQAAAAQITTAVTTQAETIGQVLASSESARWIDRNRDSGQG